MEDSNIYKGLKSFIEIEGENKDPWATKFEFSKLRDLVNEAEKLNTTHFELEIRDWTIVVNLYRQLSQREVIESDIDSLAKKQLELQLELERLEEED